MTYPAGAPTLSGDLLTINRYMQSPTYIKRLLRTISNLRFVSDQILTRRFRSTGGAVIFEQSEPILNTRTPEAVAPGSEYPRDTPGRGTAALAAVSKWGQAVFISDEDVKRNIYGGDEIVRALRKTVNTVIQQVDKVTLAAVAAAVAQTQAASAAWNNNAATILRDIELAIAQILDLQQGYVPDTILMSSTKYALLMSDQTVAALRRRETTDNPVYAGQIDVIGGLKVVSAPAGNLPNSDVWILDSTQLGGMADESDQDPGYTVDQMAVQVQTERIARRDGWDMWGRRLTVPMVMEPGAAIRVTGT